jgi:acetylornithine deacetylase/succinyl-diaminopimelate desuccinylase-like protein
MLTSLADTPCIAGFGPDGSEWTSVDEREWVDLASLQKVTEVYARTIWKYLGEIKVR